MLQIIFFKNNPSTAKLINFIIMNVSIKIDRIQQKFLLNKSIHRKKVLTNQKPIKI